MKNNTRNKVIGARYLLQSLLNDEVPDQLKEILNGTLTALTNFQKETDKQSVMAYAQTLKDEEAKIEKEVSGKLLPIVQAE